MKVPRVDDNSARTRIRDQNGDLLVVRFGLGKRVVENDVDVVHDTLVRIDFHDDDTIAVSVELLATPIRTTS
jgi:hypothetical protein